MSRPPKTSDFAEVRVIAEDTEQFNPTAKALPIDTSFRGEIIADTEAVTALNEYEAPTKLQEESDYRSFFYVTCCFIPALGIIFTGIGQEFQNYSYAIGASFIAIGAAGCIHEYYKHQQDLKSLDNEPDAELYREQEVERFIGVEEAREDYRNKIAKEKNNPGGLGR